MLVLEYARAAIKGKIPLEFSTSHGFRHPLG